MNRPRSPMETLIHWLAGGPSGGVRPALPGRSSRRRYPPSRPAEQAEVREREGNREHVPVLGEPAVLRLPDPEHVLDNVEGVFDLGVDLRAPSGDPPLDPREGRVARRLGPPLRPCSRRPRSRRSRPGAAGAAPSRCPRRWRRRPPPCARALSRRAPCSRIGVRNQSLAVYHKE